MDNNEGNFYRGTGANSLRKAEENAAAAKLDDTDDSTAGVQQVETDAEQSYYRADREDQKIRKGKVRGILKRKGVTGALIGLIFGGMVAVGGSQAMQLFSVIAQFKEAYNSMQVSTATRPIVKFQLQGIFGKEKWFGNNNGDFSAMERSGLAGHGINVAENDGVRTLEFENSNGGLQSVTADNLDETIATNPSFANDYTGGTKGWRGAISNWFNKTTDKFINSNALTRNLFSKFREDKAKAENEEAAMIEDMSKKGNADVRSGTDEVTYVNDKEVEVGKDENGKPKYELQGEGRERSNRLGNISSKNLATEEGAEMELNKIKEGFAHEEPAGDGRKGAAISLAARAAGAADIGCKAVNIINKISLLIMAHEMLQIINLTTGVFEGIDKAKAGNGNDSPINAIGNALNQKRTSDIATAVGASESSGGESTTTNKTAMEANGIVALYSGQPMDYNDPSIKSFNVTSNIPGILQQVGLDVGMYKACLNIRAAVAGVRLASLALGGLPLAAETLFHQLGVLVGGAVFGAIISAMVPMVAKFFARDLISNLGGENLGNALVSGANIYMGNAHRANGGSPATRDTYIQYAAAHEQVIAENARYERANKSPFDATSNYTFLGTLARQMMSFAGSNSLLSMLTSVGSVLSSSIMNLTPAASAYDIAKTLPEEGSSYEERCPYLASINAVGDAFCNPYIITDTSTIGEDYDPVTVAETVSSLGNEDNFDDEGNINKGSQLAKYITFCDHRNSPFGIPDQEIVSKLNATTGSEFLDTAIGMVPGLNDARELWNIGQEVQNAGFITGQACVAGYELTADERADIAAIEGGTNPVNGTTAPGNQAPEWEEAKWYQRFIEDQSILETTGVVEKSVVTAYLEEYEKENPVDNSYEGILARYSGLSKDEVIAYLDFMDYCDYIAKYDPSERYVFGQDRIEKPTQLIIEDNEFENNPQIILMDSIAYADVRNRQTIA